MTEYQNIRNKLIAVPKDQVITPAGKLDRIKQDATLWPLKGGLKHYKGWALCDGSAYDANVFPELDAALNGAGVVPNGKWRTRDINLSISLSGATLNQNLTTRGYFYTDDDGNWHINFKSHFTLTAGDAFFYFRIDGVTGYGAAITDLQEMSVYTPLDKNSNVVGHARGTDNFWLIATDTLTTEFIVNADIMLDAKPTIANFDDNLIDYPIIATADNVLSSSLGLPKADKETAGLVSYGDINQVLENECINGSFDFNQRGAASYTTTGLYTLDRFRIDHAGSTTNTVTQQQFTKGQTEVAGNPSNYMRVVTTSGNLVNSLSIMSTKLENLAKYSGEWVTIGVDLKADANKEISIEFVKNFGTGGTPDASETAIGVNKLSITNTWQRYYVTVFIPSIAANNFGTDGNDNLQVLFWLDAGSDFNARTNSLGNQSGTFEIANLDIKRTRHQTPFTRAGGTYAGEQKLCERYYYKTKDAYLNNFHGALQTYDWLQYFYPVEMRALPTVSLTVSKFSHVAGNTSLPTTTSHINVWKDSIQIKTSDAGYGLVLDAGASFDAEI